MSDELDLRRHNGDLAARLGTHLMERAATARAELIRFTEFIGHGLNRQTFQIRFALTGRFSALVSYLLRRRLLPFRRCKYLGFVEQIQLQLIGARLLA
ncbi:hypothetical protein B2K_39540 [Paenibacillus mucilaginosus K02]|uniref:Uncharacterized protein n=1 Tax=Paenibacillus mucilaginosus K02 TaxID=997761 RepID=R9ULJ0_9BACL|nr:hypothetical protein B2K_39540 [Paenibacillus mucilaginosus K02]